ncbi:MAG: hypothetical protein R6X32_01170 [Chloroflexota bacterium]
MKKWEVPLPTAVDLWAVDLDGERPSLYESLLAPDERERAGRFHFERDRNRYIVGRGRLRQLLGHYLAIPPAQVVFAYTDHGKPYLAPQPGRPDLTFNISHSQQFALLAFAWGQRLGVDVEVIRPLSDAAALVRRFFAPAEAVAWEAVPPQQQAEAFFFAAGRARRPLSRQLAMASLTRWTALWSACSRMSRPNCWKSRVARLLLENGRWRRYGRFPKLLRP